MRRTEVLVVGAGPVGLFLAGLLADRGVDVAVLERRERPPEHSRAIGLHPPALDALAVLGLDRAAVAEGVPVRRGVGYGDGRLLGRLTFERAHPRHPFVLTLPQSRTERLLAEHLERLAPGALHRGVEAVGLDQPENDDGARARVSVRRVGATGTETGTQVWAADVVVAADGAHSTVRRLSGIGTDRRDWGDSYLMGDFADPDASREPAAEPTAVIHLHRDGVVESFPLPGGQRRWVVHHGPGPRVERARSGAEQAKSTDELAEELVDVLRERWPPTGATADLPDLPGPATATMVNAFTVYRQMARRMVSGCVVLVGDAAHAITPFGGQGMTLGWLDALALAPLVAAGPASGSLTRVSTTSGPLEDRPEFAAFERNRHRAALRAARQAEVNMLLGRPLASVICRGRDSLARGVMATPLRHRLARLYTMGWAEQP